MSFLEVLKLGDNQEIFRGIYSGPYSKLNFLEKIKINALFTKNNHNNSTWIEIVTPEFDSIESQIRFYLEEISKAPVINYSRHLWVYTQKIGFNLEWMHQHILVHPNSRTNITADYTFTYYVQVPTDLKADEGKLVFETKDGNQYKFLPKENEIYIFPADLRHTAIPTPNNATERIVIAGSFCLDIFKQKHINKQII